jgi:hypothetical protein
MAARGSVKSDGELAVSEVVTGWEIGPAAGCSKKISRKLVGFIDSTFLAIRIATIGASVAAVEYVSGRVSVLVAN